MGTALESKSMKHLLTRTVVILAALPTAPAALAADLKFATFDESRAHFDGAVTPFFAKHCQACHNAKTSEGDLNLAELDPNMKDSTSGARWAMLVEKLTNGEMPPKDRLRPTPNELSSVIRWAHAETKRAGKHFARREAYANGNSVPHELLFDPRNVPPYDGDPRIRRLSPEIYAGFLKDHAKRPGANQAFSPDGKTTFRDMGAPKIDEPVTATLFQNALVVVESQTDFRLEDGKVKGNLPREFSALLHPDVRATDEQLAAAIAYQFNTILKRPPTDDERRRFLTLMHKNIADAGPLLGARYTLAAVLMLPEAVFRLEVGTGKPDDKGRVRLGPREIAFAVAYGLTDRRPDAELLKAAATGELDTDEGVARQIRRLLDDPKVDAASVVRFFREYFGYDGAIDVFKDPDDGGLVGRFPDHDARVLVEDTDRLVEYVLEQDREVLRELLTTNLSFVSYRNAAEQKAKRAEAWAKFEADKKKNPEKYKDKIFKPQGRQVFLSYNLDDFPDEQPVKLPSRERAGLLTQPSWLVANSTTFDNHAIHRGKWIRERLLGGVVPDVPITVDAQLPIAPERTLRQRMAVTQQEYCWKCHQLMNDVGYPFEQFDHFGRYRQAEAVLDSEATANNVDKKGKPLGSVARGVPVDARGLIAHVGDASLEGPVENLHEYMLRLASSERVEQVFIRHAFRFWLGRNETLGDAGSLQTVHRAYRASGGSMKALITALLTSESFLYRVPK